MFDFAWSELGLIGLISVLVLGPKQLPETMRTMAKVMRRVRSLGAEFQGHVNDMVREAELEEVRDQVKKLSSTSIKEEMTKLIDPGGEISQITSDVQSDVHAALNPEAPKLAPSDEPAPATTELQPDPSAPAVAAPAAEPAPKSAPAHTPPAGTAT